MVRRKKEDALVTRGRILDAAEHMFQQQGVSRTSLNDIAQAAGVTRGAIYWHFQDKADLFNAMMVRATLPLEEEALSLSDPTLADPLAELRRKFISALRRVVSDPQMRRVFEVATHKVEYTDEMHAARDRHLASRNNCLAHVESGLTLAMQRGQLQKRMPARAAALGLHALIDGLIQNWMLDPTGFDLARVGTQVLDAYLAGMTPPAPPAAALAPAKKPGRTVKRSRP